MKMRILAALLCTLNALSASSFATEPETDLTPLAGSLITCTYDKSLTQGTTYRFAADGTSVERGVLDSAGIVQWKSCEQLNRKRLEITLDEKKKDRLIGVDSSYECAKFSHEKYFVDDLIFTIITTLQVQKNGQLENKFYVEVRGGADDVTDLNPFRAYVHSDEGAYTDMIRRTASSSTCVVPWKRN